MNLARKTSRLRACSLNWRHRKQRISSWGSRSRSCVTQMSVMTRFSWFKSARKMRRSVLCRIKTRVERVLRDSVELLNKNIRFTWKGNCSMSVDVLQSNWKDRGRISLMVVIANTIHSPSMMNLICMQSLTLSSTRQAVLMDLVQKESLDSL